MNLYELIVAFKPDLSKEVIDELNSKIQSYITDNKGKIESFDSWGLKKLAYPIDKYFDADFYLCRFNLEPALVLALKDIVRLNEKIIRHNIMKIEKDYSLRKKKTKKVFEEAVVEKEKVEVAE